MRRLRGQIQDDKKQKLTTLARQARVDVLTMIQNAGSGNPGSALSCVEILTWLLHHEMHLENANPKWENRDRLVLSKGHAAPVFYSLVTHFGWVGRDELSRFRCFGTRLQTHPDYQKLPCIDFPSGSLGQGLSAANGMSLAARYLGLSEPRFFVLIGDGELQEGQIWEAAMTAGHYGLENVIAIIDRNFFQGDAAIVETMTLEPIVEKWQAFNWQVQTAEGHDFVSLSTAFSAFEEGKPKLIIANTVKGKGVSFMEKNNNWHVGGKKFTAEKLGAALEEINGKAS